MVLHLPTCGQTRIVLVGGLDPSGGAGVGRDLLTATQLSARASIVGTAWTEQGFASVHRVEAREPDRVEVALAGALAAVGASESAVKIGMVATASIARAIVGGLASYGGPVVFDPVRLATSGGWLYDGDHQAILTLARKASLFTPNLDEAAWILDRPVRSEMDAREAARALFGLGIPAVLVKGGHLSGDASDVLRSAAGERAFTRPRVPGQSPRGTGCALATAIAVELARGESLENAVARAKAWLTDHIAAAASVGSERHL